jgi:hypothetical protein
MISQKLIGLLSLSFSMSLVIAQKHADSVYIDSKVWSRDANRKIQYSNWQSFGCITVDSLRHFNPNTSTPFDAYGGDASEQFIAKNFFYTVQKNKRWWIVDPAGNAYLNIAVNGVRLGKSPNNEQAFATKFKTNNSWIQATQNIMLNAGFNGTGSWSDIETIKAYNVNNPKPIVYSTQLSLLGTFAQKEKKASGSKEYPVLAYIFNPNFKNFCFEKAKELAKDKDDANLFGHFSDNELPFQENILKLFIDINNPADSAYLLAAKWAKDMAINIDNITKEQKEKFSGFVAERYYQTMAEAIKQSDPNHLYLGSRLHASAKNNPYILAAAEKYVDIISINYYGNWAVTEAHRQQWLQLKRPFIITEFYTKGEDSKMGNMTGAGWLVKTQEDRGIHYQNFCINLLQMSNCVGWHWFRYQDNDPNDASADPSNNDANKGIVNVYYEVYNSLIKRMQQLNINAYQLIKYFNQNNGK